MSSYSPLKKSMIAIAALTMGVVSFCGMPREAIATNLNHKKVFSLHTSNGNFACTSLPRRGVGTRVLTASLISDKVVLTPRYSFKRTMLDAATEAKITFWYNGRRVWSKKDLDFFVASSMVASTPEMIGKSVNGGEQATMVGFVYGYDLATLTDPFPSVEGRSPLVDATGNQMIRVVCPAPPRNEEPENSTINVNVPDPSPALYLILELIRLILTGGERQTA